MLDLKSGRWQMRVIFVLGLLGLLTESASSQSWPIYKVEVVAPPEAEAEDLGFRLLDGNDKGDFCGILGKAQKGFAFVDGEYHEIKIPSELQEEGDRILPFRITENGKVLCLVGSSPEFFDEDNGGSFIWQKGGAVEITSVPGFDKAGCLSVSPNGDYLIGVVVREDGNKQLFSAFAGVAKVFDWSFDISGGVHFLDIANDGTFVGKIGSTVFFREGNFVTKNPDLENPVAISANGNDVFYSKETTLSYWACVKRLGEEGYLEISKRTRVEAVSPSGKYVLAGVGFLQNPFGISNKGEPALFHERLHGDWEQRSLSDLMEEDSRWIMEEDRVTKWVAVSDSARIYADVVLEDGRQAGLVFTPLDYEDKEPVHDGAKKLVFICHGWKVDSSGWASGLGDKYLALLEDKGVSDDWRVMVFDWRLDSGKIEWSLSPDFYGFYKGLLNPLEKTKQDFLILVSGSDILPTKAAENARALGKEFGEIFAQQDLEVVHLIGHSAGAHFVEAICEELSGTDAYVHLTLLDAFVPKDGVGSQPFGDDADFAEHYRDSRTSDLLKDKLFGLVEGTAGSVLDQCWNMDVSSFDDPDSIAPKGGQSKTSTDQMIVETWSHYHAFPTRWYTNSKKNEGDISDIKDLDDLAKIIGSGDFGYGLLMAPAFGGKQSHQEFPRGNDFSGD